MYYAQTRSSSAVLCAWGGGKLLLFNKFSRNVITRQEHKMGGGLTWWGCLLLSYMHQNQKREREREPKKWASCRGSEFTKVSRRECENELVVVVDAHTINRTKEDTHKKKRETFLLCDCWGSVSHQPTSTLSKKTNFLPYSSSVCVCMLFLINEYLHSIHFHLTLQLSEFSNKRKIFIDKFKNKFKRQI
jgi:hypothetical protein